MYPPGCCEFDFELAILRLGCRLLRFALWLQLSWAAVCVVLLLARAPSLLTRPKYTPTNLQLVAMQPDRCCSSPFAQVDDALRAHDARRKEARECLALLERLVDAQLQKKEPDLASLVGVAGAWAVAGEACAAGVVSIEAMAEARAEHDCLLRLLEADVGDLRRMRTFVQSVSRSHSLNVSDSVPMWAPTGPIWEPPRDSLSPGSEDED